MTLFGKSRPGSIGFCLKALLVGHKSLDKGCSKKKPNRGFDLNLSCQKTRRFLQALLEMKLFELWASSSILLLVTEEQQNDSVFDFKLCLANFGHLDCLWGLF